MENQLKYWQDKKINFKVMEKLFRKKNYIHDNNKKPLVILKVIFDYDKFHLKINIGNKNLDKIECIKRFLKNLIKINKNLNCVIYIILNDHVTADKYYISKDPKNKNIKYDEERKNMIINFNKNYYILNNYPFFSFIKPLKSNFICLPDTMFLRDYSSWHRADNNGRNKTPLKIFINQINDNAKFENKKNMFVFKSQYWKYKEIKIIICSNTKKGKRNVSRNFLSKQDQIIKYKYLIGTFLRWDTTYWQLLSNSPVFMITKLTDEILDTHPILYVSFLYYYTKPYEDYIPIQLDKINEYYEKYKNDDKTLKKIAKNSTKKMNTLTYDKVLNDFSNLMNIYNKIYNENL